MPAKAMRLQKDGF